MKEGIIAVISLCDTTVLTHDRSTQLTTKTQDFLKTSYINTAFFLSHHLKPLLSFKRYKDRRGVLRVLNQDLLTVYVLKSIQYVEFPLRTRFFFDYSGSVNNRWI